MRSFDYDTVPAGLLTVETMNLVSALHECRGQQSASLRVKSDVLDALVEVAKVQSADASNRIEGIRTSDRRLRQIMSEKTDLRSRDEEEIAGYRDVLQTVHERHDDIDVTPNVILQLHRDMYRHTPSSLGGRFKVGDNEIRGVRADGTEYVRFRPVPAVSTPDAMQRLCTAYNRAIAAGKADPLLVLLQFAFDFTCIHPFNDGNGRMSRLLTLLLLYKAGYMVGKYVSIEKEIERTKGAYYDALAASSDGWDRGANDPGPFVRYMLGVVLACYRDFERRVAAVTSARLSKAERVEAAVRTGVGKVTKADILQACPDISKVTVERALHALLEAGKVRKVGVNRATGYVWAAHASCGTPPAAGPAPQLPVGPAPPAADPAPQPQPSSGPAPQPSSGPALPMDNS